MYNIPASIPKKIFSIDSFMGVDFSSSPIEIDKRRSPNAKNIINNNGYNESRNGYEILNTIGTKINGMWNIDTDKGELFLVHSGDKLYEVSNDFKVSTVILTGMSDCRSSGQYFEDKLVIFDGTRVVIYGKYEDSYEAKFLDTCGYIPTTSVGRNAAGGGTDYEKINIMSPYRINTFLTEKIKNEITDSEGKIQIEETDQTVFPLDDTNIDSIELVEVMSSEGIWNVVSSTEYEVDTINGKVTFKTAPGDSPVLGRDNVSIRYKKSIPSETNKINKCTIATLFGYEGNNNRIFASGNSDLPNYDFHCEQDDPTYWPDENFTKIGVEPIINYSRLNDGSLAIQKRQSDTDCTLYYRKSSLLNSTEVFPLEDGIKNTGCISRYANSNLLNDPLTLTNQGVFAILGADNGEKTFQQRSYYVNGKLMNEENLEDAIAITHLGKYYLCVNNHVYIADSRYLSYPKHAKTEQYQYEWWYWDNIPARVLLSWNDKLLFGTEDGRICIFNDSYLDIDVPVDVYWETPFLDMGTNVRAKTIKNITAVLNPIVDSDLVLGYELDDGTSEIVTKEYRDLKDDFPKIIQEKERIKQVMFIKFFIKNNKDTRLTFERLFFEYVIAGKYRGN